MKNMKIKIFNDNLWFSISITDEFEVVSRGGFGLGGRENGQAISYAFEP